jgi:hypothetical protein
MLVWFYQHYFGAPEMAATPVRPYQPTAEQLGWCRSMFAGDDYNADFRLLKHNLAQFGLAIPTLYKQYTELCEPGGVRILGFNLDPAFQHCVDALIMVDLSMLKPHKIQRYLGSGSESRNTDR